MSTSEVVSALQNADPNGDLEVNFVYEDGTTYTPITASDIVINVDNESNSRTVINVNHPLHPRPTVS